MSVKQVEKDFFLIEAARKADVADMALKHRHQQLTRKGENVKLAADYLLTLNDGGLY
jgi:hypothetical protein